MARNIFINVSARMGAMLLIAAALVLWALVAPESFGSAVDTAMDAVSGAVRGARANL